jgi:hypothetical protein
MDVIEALRRDSKAAAKSAIDRFIEATSWVDTILRSMTAPVLMSR